MSDQILIDELHLSVFVPRSLPQSQTERVVRALRRRRFRTELQRALRGVFRRSSALRVTQLKLAR